MNKEAVCKEIAKIIEENLGISSETIHGDSRLMEDLGASSFDIMMLLPKIEETYKIEFSVRALRNMITIDDIVEYIEQQTK